MKTGDIVFYTNSDAKDWKSKILGALNSWSEGTKYTHCEIIYLVLAENKVVTLSADYKINFKVVNVENKKVVALNRFVDEEKLQKVIFEYQQDKILKSNNKYSYRGLLNASIASLLHKFKLTEKTQLLTEEAKSYCSELIIEILKIYGIDLKLNDNIATPGDLFEKLTGRRE